MLNMRDRQEISSELQQIIGERWKPLFSSSVFKRITDSFYDFIHWKKLEIDYYDAKKNYLEDLQEWEHLKSNYIPPAPKKEVEFDKLRAMYLQERELIRSQL